MTPTAADQLQNSGNPIRALFAYEDKKDKPKHGGLMSCVTGNTNGECSDVAVQIPVEVNPHDPSSTVPEPGMAGLLGLGALGLLVGRRRRG